MGMGEQHPNKLQRLSIALHYTLPHLNWFK
nr:MAG TPA: hypothetical protein [Caudoviricetes sp.]